MQKGAEPRIASPLFSWESDFNHSHFAKVSLDWLTHRLLFPRLARPVTLPPPNRCEHQDRQAAEGCGPVAEDVIGAGAAVGDDVGNEHLRCSPWTLREDPPVAVDPGREAGIGRDDGRLAVLDCPEDCTAEMQVENGGPPEPAVVGYVNQHVGRRASPL
jgi:hypothetical protein